MRPWLLVAGIVAMAGLDLCALSGGPFAIVALAGSFALLVAGVETLRNVPVASVAKATALDWDDAPSRLDRRDRVIMTACGASSFALSLIGYWRPPDKIFDEVYFARAAEEYLRNARIYESTHPPLTKLIITASVWLFGGLARGDTAYGWRFGDVTFSALAVVVLYALAKRVSGSTWVATLAASFFIFDGMHFVQSRVATPEGIVIFFSISALYAVVCSNVPASGITIGALIGSKWYGIMMLGVAAVAEAMRPVDLRRALARYGTIVALAAGVYALVWIPDLVRNSPDPNEIHSIADVFERQYDMYYYHSTLHATHPYASKWWEWPFDYVPIAYYYHPDPQATPENPSGCCIREVESMPNPIGLWMGLACVPVLGVLAWRERRRGYALIVAAYVLQWLPWAASPRISWEYHFYVDVPLVCVANAIVLRRISIIAAAAGAGAVAVSFVFFYPILSAMPLTFAQWHDRMWLPTWIIGPG